MSQAGSISVSSTPTVPTTFTTDSGNATPAANVINFLGIDSTENNANGISTSGSGNTVNVILTNRVQGSDAGIVGATTSDLVTLAAGATPGTYTFDIRGSAFESTTPAGAGFHIRGSARTTGAATSLIGSPDMITNKDAALAASNLDIVVSANNIIVQATGVAGLTTSFNTTGLFTFIS